MLDRVRALAANGVADGLALSEHFDPSLPHQGPFPDKNNRIRIHTIRETPEGPTTKVTVVDVATAWVMEQHVFDAQGRLKASSLAEGYRRDPLSGLFLPSAVQVSCPAAQFSMRLDLGNAQINRLSGNPAELWTMPSYPGTPMVDLCNPNLIPPAAASPPAAAVPAMSNRPRRDRPPRM